MFSTIVAGTLFTLIAVFGLVVLFEAIVNHSHNKLRNDLRRAMGKPVYRYSGKKLGILFAVWFACGVYLFG